MAKSGSSAKLKQLLDLVPLLQSNPGIHMDKLLALTPYKNRGELTDALDRLLMIGLPPFTPADFIDIYIDDSERITLTFPHGLDRPLALTPAEWNALRNIVTGELEYHKAGTSHTETLRNLLTKLSADPLIYDESSPFSYKRSLVEEAMEEDQQIQFLYQSLSDREVRLRRVDPYALFVHRGSAYLIGFCHTRQEPRSFHLERMTDIEILDEERLSDIPEDLEKLMENSPIFRGLEDSLEEATILFRADIRAALEYYFPLNHVSPHHEDGGGRWMVGRCFIREENYFISVMKSFGPRVVITQPEKTRQSILQEIQKTAIPSLLE